ncbi:hypothetical protein A3C86_00685 [Candidatus Kaiserbacteria bacterium RIFCSPHIGHO2_02_FULL_49_16]|uniref:Uncharacterized protein n=1 Tax=Candidatus Kaiserbacteria bacterium RIFCSPHIGHO2_02_FULL_49_16 TaxID=1798490 RepID=A0A1F6DDG0_9BACT|nr:MAG: hypothetical protein A3C86_00685 [Candidatus Kaiserbacteria bacterium RIFCSPHIGHO2_02_FULL_49_16]
MRQKTELISPKSGKKEVASRKDSARDRKSDIPPTGVADGKVAAIDQTAGQTAMAGKFGRDAALKNARKAEILKAHIPITDANFSKIVKLSRTHGNPEILEFETIDSHIDIHLKEPASWGVVKVSGENVIFMSSKKLKDGQKEWEARQQAKQMTSAEKAELLKQFPIQELFIAFEAADKIVGEQSNVDTANRVVKEI